MNADMGVRHPYNGCSEKLKKTCGPGFSEQKMSLYGKWMLRKPWALIFLSKKCRYMTTDAQKI